MHETALALHFTNPSLYLCADQGKYFELRYRENDG